MRYLIVIAITVASAILYRWGGSDRFNTKVRDFGCAALNLLSLFILIGASGHWLQWFLTFGATFGSYTTYHKWMNKYFGDSRYNVHWYGWLMHGFCLGLSTIFFIEYWKKTLMRAGIVGVAVMIWSVIIGKDTWEERGRGFIVNISMLIYA